MDSVRMDFSSESRRLLSFFPRYSAFEPVAVRAGISTGLPVHFYRPTSYLPSPPAHITTLLSSSTSSPTEAPFRNWMLEKGDSGSDHTGSSRYHSSPSPTTTSEQDEELSPLPSPSNLPFHPRKCRESKKERRARTTFTSPQTQVLEVEYRRSEYISRPRRYELATQLNLKEVQIKIWYQNRRAKDKRIEKASWDRQYRCLGLAAAHAAVAVNQFPPPGPNYRLTTGLGGQLQHPLHMFPSSSATSFPIPLLEHFQQGVNRQLGLAAATAGSIDKGPLNFSSLKKI